MDEEKEEAVPRFRLLAWQQEYTNKLYNAYAFLYGASVTTDAETRLSTEVDKLRKSIMLEYAYSYCVFSAVLYYQLNDFIRSTITDPTEEKQEAYENTLYDLLKGLDFFSKQELIEKQSKLPPPKNEELRATAIKWLTQGLYPSKYLTFTLKRSDWVQKTVPQRILKSYKEERILQEKNLITLNNDILPAQGWKNNFMIPGVKYQGLPSSYREHYQDTAYPIRTELGKGKETDKTDPQEAVSYHPFEESVKKGLMFVRYGKLCIYEGAPMSIQGTTTPKPRNGKDPVTGKICQIIQYELEHSGRKILPKDFHDVYFHGENIPSKTAKAGQINALKRKPLS